MFQFFWLHNCSFDNISLREFFLPLSFAWLLECLCIFSVASNSLLVGVMLLFWLLKFWVFSKLSSEFTLQIICSKSIAGKVYRRSDTHVRMNKPEICIFDFFFTLIIIISIMTMILKTENNKIEHSLAVVFSLNGFITAIDGYKTKSPCQYKSVVGLE